MSVCLLLGASLLAPPATAQPAQREREAERSGGWRALGEVLGRELEREAERGREQRDRGRAQPPAGSWDSELRRSMRDGRADPGARRAAERAVARHGGRVLSVVAVGERYRVRLLLDSGRVMTATVED
jgi:hypothetical protein